MSLFSAETKKLFVCIFAAKILILGVFLIVFGESRLLWADTPTYLDLGRNIALGNGFSQTASDGSVISNTRFMPLYPMLIGVFSVYIPHGLVFVSFLQALAATGIAVFAYKIGLFFLPYRWALSAALIATFEPLISAMHILIMPETVFVFFLIAFIYFFIRYVSIFGKSDFLMEVRLPYVGLFFALVFLMLAAYTKPAALYLAIFPVLFLIFTKHEFMRAGIFTAVFVLAFIPWMARNAAVGGSFAVTNDDIGNICGWTLHGILATKYGLDPTDWNSTWNRGELWTARERCVSPLAALRIFLFEYPEAFLKTMTLSSLSLLTNDGYSVFFEKPQEEQVKPHHNFLTPAVFAMHDWKEKFSAALQEFSNLELAIIFAGKLFWAVLLTGALIGAGLLIKNHQHRVLALFIACIVFYFVGVTVFVTAYGAGARLRYPASPFLIILATCGAEWLYRKIWQKKKILQSTELLTTQNAVL